MENKKYYTKPIFWLSLIWIIIISVGILHIIWSVVVVQLQIYYYSSESFARIYILAIGTNVNIWIIATITFILHIILMFLQIIAIVRLLRRKSEDDIAIAVLYILACVFGPIFSFGGSILAKKSEKNMK
ncbi:hypothetical protein NPA13_03035 [Mycoplasma sp. 2045]|uniref:hypothetical protein n=1 Tax=Mycoplasma sp. 2045 TaxID=2967301 RepID=UPI00211BF3A0|nr:hypothetical protein [Mycoplasma sp. 2045]UUM20404.1 hypothetical protein NPA13_03035 [Mycoplasma sp. 2045]